MPDHGTVYYKSFWGAYKGHVRGMLRGLLIGAVAGLAVGAGLAALSLTPLAAPLLLGAHFSIGAIIATFTGVGAIFGAELLGKIGNSAGNAAAQFAESEMRLRYPSLPEISADSPAPGFGHHFEIPPDDDKGFFHRRVALPGLLVGTAIGALLAFGVPHAGVELLGHIGFDIFGHGAATAATIGAGGLMGASFGVNRGKFKSLFNFTDNLMMGRLGGPDKDQIERDRARYKEQDPSKPYVITGAQRYDEYQRLLTGYYKRAFSAGWNGDQRGLLGGGLAGILSGLAAGGLVCAGLAAFFPPAIPFIPVILSLCAGLGGRQGMHIFADAGREPAAFSVTKEIYAERIKSLREGKDITFDEAEDRACNRLTHHPDMDAPGTGVKTWYNWKVGLVGLAAGILLGVALAPIVGGAALHLLGAEFAIGTMAALTQVMPICATIFGLAGATFGMGDKTMDKINGVADNIFMGTFLPGHSVHDHKTDQYPAVAPDSPLLAKAVPTAIEKPAPVTDSPQQIQTSVPTKTMVGRVSTGSASRDYLREILDNKKSAAFTERNLQNASTETTLGRA